MKFSQFILTLVVLAILAAVTPAAMFARTIMLINATSQPVWAAWQGNTVPSGGGRLLQPGEKSPLSVPDNWSSARIWGRTGCQFDDSGNGNCATGDCGGKLSCAGSAGTPPATILEITLKGFQSLDYYDINLAEGYNLPITFRPVSGSFKPRSQANFCQTASCEQDLNRTCPPELQVKALNGQVIACQSPCRKFGDDAYCCRNAYGTPSACPPSPYTKVFQNACKGAYSYAYDDEAITYSCMNAQYELIFGTDLVKAAQAVQKK